MRNLSRRSIVAMLALGAVVVFGPALGFVWWILSSSSETTVETNIALAIYGAQIQFAALFAALSPIMVAFSEYATKRSDKKRFARFAIIYAIAILIYSTVAIFVSLSNMISKRFSVFAVLSPFAFAMLELSTLVVYLMASLVLMD